MDQPRPHPIFTAEHDELRASVRRFVDKELAPARRRVGGRRLLPRRRLPPRAASSASSASTTQSAGAAAAATSRPRSCSSRSSPSPAAARSRWRSACRPTWRRRRSPSSGPTIRRSATCGRRSPARRSPRSRSPSPTPAPTSPRSRRVPCATATCGASTVARCSSPTDFAPTSSPASCRPSPAPATAASRLFIVDTDLPGVSVSRKLEKLGMRSSDTAEIALDDVAVPHANLIGGEPGQGFAQLMWQLQYERMSGAAACVGTADRGARRHDRVRPANVTRSDARSRTIR